MKKSDEIKNRIAELEARTATLETEILEAEDQLGEAMSEGIDPAIPRALLAGLREEAAQLPRVIVTVKKKLNDALLEELEADTAKVAERVEKILPSITQAAEELKRAVEKYNVQIDTHAEKLRDAGLAAPEEVIFNLAGGRGLPGYKVSDFLAQTKELPEFLAERVRYRVLTSGRDKRSYELEAAARRLR